MTAVLKKSGVDGIPDIYAGGGSLIHLSIVLTGLFELSLIQGAIQIILEI